MAVLVTGGCGAIDSNLVKRLLLNNKVIVMDDLSEGAITNIPLANENLTPYFSSVNDTSVLDKIFNEDIDCVYHLAASFANEKSVRDPLQDANVNINGTLNVLEHCRKKDVKFVYASSSSCYSGLLDASFKEDMMPHPSTPYAISKYSGELYAMAYNKIYGLPTTAIRYFYSYGPGERPGQYRNVIPNWVQSALNGEQLTITGTGDEVRDFTYVDDTIDLTLLAANAPNAIGEVFNSGTGTPTKIVDLANKINVMTGNYAGVRYLEPRAWDTVPYRVANIKKSKDLLGYNPKVSLDDGLKKTIDWMEML